MFKIQLKILSSRGGRIQPAIFVKVSCDLMLYGRLLAPKWRFFALAPDMHVHASSISTMKGWRQEAPEVLNLEMVHLGC